MIDYIFVTEAITEHWGDRCAYYEQTCSCCRAWAEYDRMCEAEGDRCYHDDDDPACKLEHQYMQMAAKRSLQHKLEIIAAAEAERERCAKIAESGVIMSYSPHQHPEKIAAAIRLTPSIPLPHLTNRETR